MTAAEAAAEQERIEAKNRRLLSGTGVGEIGTRISQMLHVDFFAQNLTLGFSDELSKDLADMGRLARYKSWLRGMLSALSIISFVLAFLSIELQSRLIELSEVVHIQLKGHEYINFANMFVCFAGMYCVVRVYQIKARQAGVSNPLYLNDTSLLHSPYLPQMFLELCLWTFTPPYVVSHYRIKWLLTIDFISFFRLYNIALWLANRRYSNRAFCRALSALSGIKLSTGFYLRTAMLYKRFQTIAVTSAIGWFAVTLAFSKAEGHSYWDSLYFMFVTGATIGYGDISPVTKVGRIASFIAWLYGLLIIGWGVAIFQMYVNLTEQEKNIYVLFRTNELTNRLRHDSATLIQRTYRIHMRNKLTKSTSIFTDIALLRLARLTANIKVARHELRTHTLAYAQVMAVAAFTGGGGGDEEDGDGDKSGKGKRVMPPLGATFGSALASPMPRGRQPIRPIGSVPYGATPFGAGFVSAPRSKRKQQTQHKTDRRHSGSGREHEDESKQGDTASVPPNNEEAQHQPIEIVKIPNRRRSESASSRVTISLPASSPASLPLPPHQQPVGTTLADAPMSTVAAPSAAPSSSEAAVIAEQSEAIRRLTALLEASMAMNRQLESSLEELQKTVDKISPPSS